MLLSSCTSALGRPFLFPSAGSSHTGLCLLLFSGPGVVLTGSWGCPCLGVRPLGSPDEDSFPSLGPLGLSMPELSGSHPALGAGWPRVTHVREEGVRRQAPKVGVFPPMFYYMAITPAVRQGPVRQGLGGLKGSGQSSPSSYPPLLCGRRQGAREKKSRAGEEKLQFSSAHEKKSWILSPYSQFPIALPPSFPALICIAYHEALLQPLSSR